ncbi:MAG: VCBS repeat-containing protein [Flavisolibacter sp.]
MKTCLLPILLIFLYSCSSKKTSSLFDLVENSGINFNNKVVDDKLENSFLFRNMYNGGGVAIGDINNDGLPDVMLTSNQGENKLYLNKGNFKFEDISATAGLQQNGMWSTGVSFADINADGWLDIYVCNSGHMPSGHRRNQLYINQQNNSFKEEAAAYGLDLSAYSTHASFFDYDLDGDLDCFLINNSPIPINTLGYSNRRSVPAAQWAVADFLKGGGDHLYRNENGKFREVTAEAGIHGTLMSFGLGVTVGDVNSDGYPDVYVANDSYERDYLYINQKDGTFKDELEACVGQNSFSSMGADLSDVNNDGYPDIFTTDMLPADDYRLKTLGAFDNIDLHLQRLRTGLYYQYMKNCLMVNNKNGEFLETANFSGVEATDWSWGALFFDADNDGLNDIFVCNGVNRDVTDLDFMEFFANDVIQKMVLSGHKQSVDSVLHHIPVNPVANAAFQNTGDLKFKNVSNEWGFATPSFSNGAAYADLDGDGDLDLVVNNENQQAFVYRNNTNQQLQYNYLSVQLKGSGQNTFAVGTKIKAFADGQIFYRELFPARGFQSSVDYTQVIGLGKINHVDSLLVIWPNGTYSKLLQPALNKKLLMQEPADAPAYYLQSLATATTLFEPLPASLDKHQEDEYVDFYFERNLPEMLSGEGPHAAKIDVNGDGLEDIYIGGAKGQAGQLYLQTAKGGFKKSKQAIFQQFQDLEDVAVLFFDADKDGDCDLFIGAGGNNVPPGQREMQHRLYKNDGKGNFSIDVNAFPPNDMNIAVAAAYDYDGDGDEDIFVGSRSVPRIYGQTPKSYLYENDGNGHFKDVTPPAIASAGMVTAAAWADVTGDGKKELVVTGAWMHTKIFSRRNGRFEELKNTGLENLNGWWQSLAVADVNGDGKEDLVIGNMGENFYLRPTPEAPAKLWLQDLDGNGTPDAFLTRTAEGKDVPVFLKREITDQFPALKKGNLKNSDYAKKTIQDLFGKEKLKDAIQRRFDFAASIVALNDGSGHFSVQRLPLPVQLSSVSAICVTDINSDGKTDLLLGGNNFTFPPQFGRLDASFGHVLTGKGDGSFTYVETRHSGINLKGQVKDIKEIQSSKGSTFIFLQNDSIPRMFRLAQNKNERLTNAVVGKR